MDTKILIVSDEHETQALYVDTLASQGYEVVWEKSGREALSLVQRIKPTLVLLGIMIADMDGLHILEFIKTNPETEDTKVFMLSAIDDECIIKKAYDLGADDYLIRKVITIPELLKKVDKAICRR